MKKKLMLFLILFLLVFGFSVAEAREGFVIRNYDIILDVRDDHSILITETIDMEYQLSLHGFYRTIPLRTHFDTLAKINELKMLSSHIFAASRQGNIYEIKIGDPNANAKKLEQYIIQYRFHLGDDQLPDLDELYFNLIGTDWNTSIENVQFQINMPHPFNPDLLSFTYGLSFSQESQAVTYTVDGQKITGQLNRALEPYEGLTVALPLPQGYYSTMPKNTDYIAILDQFAPLFYAIVTVLGGLLWFRKGRNQEVIPTVEFYPPPGLTSADIGYIFDNQVDTHDITSLILYWASKGYLAIEETTEKVFLFQQSSFTFIKLRELDDSAKSYEKKMFRDLFDVYGNGKQVVDESLKNKFYKTLEEAKRLLLYGFTQREENRVYSRWIPFNQAVLLLFALLSSFLAHLAFVSILFKDPIEDLAMIALVVMSVTLVFTFGGLYLFTKARRSGGRGLQVLSILLLGVLFGLFILLSSIAFTAGRFLPVVLGLVSFFTLMVAFFYADQRTDLGNQYMAKLLGFRTFLMDAEKDRIETLANENPEYFYNVLPYAMVLGVSEAWAKKFEHLTLTPPTWYVTNRPYGNFNSMLFYHSFNNSMASFSASMTSMPSQRGGGSVGGGFSGGGSGGGGGRGW
jgi:uncharacterized membrane protein YgcG